MIDNFSLGLSHLIMILVAWLLIFRPDLDKEAPVEPDADPAPRFGQKPRKTAPTEDAGGA